MNRLLFLIALLIAIWYVGIVLAAPCCDCGQACPCEGKCPGDVCLPYGKAVRLAIEKKQSLAIWINQKPVRCARGCLTTATRDGSGNPRVLIYIPHPDGGLYHLSTVEGCPTAEQMKTLPAIRFVKAPGPPATVTRGPWIVTQGSRIHAEPIAVPGK